MVETQDTHFYWRINEIKNAIYCSRIPYYALCLGLDRDTAVSRIGIEAEQDTKNRMRRRKHALHAVHDGTRYFDFEVTQHTLRLVGRLDEVIKVETGVYLVDYKDTDEDHGYWHLQMAAYRLAARSNGMTVLGSYVYTIPDQTYHELTLTRQHEQRLHEILRQLEEMVKHETTPPPTKHHKKCLTCQYRRFCNDVR
jgi:CRISPR-associated exonuclease Cas4